jgi:hypothetical protein
VSPPELGALLSVEKRGPEQQRDDATVCKMARQLDVFPRMAERRVSDREVEWQGSKADAIEVTNDSRVREL